MTDRDLEALLLASTNMPKAGLATRILVSRLRIEVRARPVEMAGKLAELKAYLSKNPAEAATLA